MDALDFRQTDFFLDQQRIKKWWVGPIFFAVCIHVLALAASVSLPILLARRPLLDEVVTVNLVSLPDSNPSLPEPPAQVQKPVQPAQKKIIEPLPEKPAVKIPEPVKTETVAAQPVQPISITPKKRKIQKTQDTRLAEEKEKQTKLLAEKIAREQKELERQQRQAQARLDELRADEKARAAREELAALIRETGSAKSSGSSGSKQVSMVLKQYLSSIDGRLRRFWILPEMRKWDQNLETVVVLTIRKDGTVVSQMIEKKSNDPFYDQFVLKTIQSSLPMPPFPALMSEQSIEIGIRFRPGELLF